MNNEYFLNYEPSLWNCDAVRKSANCYQYMLDDLDYKRIENCNTKLNNKEKDCGAIGMLCPDKKCKKLKTKCEQYKYNVLYKNKHRNIFEASKEERCPEGFYKGALFLHH